MNVLIVFCHPEPTSFNGALKDVAVATLTDQGHAVRVSDLYGEGFDPVEAPRHFPDRAEPERFSPLAEQRHAYRSGSLPADVAREIERLDWADLVILQFPIWWHAQPAMLKGWYDRVFVGGGLYTSAMRYGRGYFRGRRALCSVTIGAPAEVCVPGGRGGDIDTLLWPIQYSLHYMGYSVLPPCVAHEVQGAGFRYHDDGDTLAAHLEGRKAELARRLRTLEATAPLRFPDWPDWDETGRPLQAASQAASQPGAASSSG